MNPTFSESRLIWLAGLIQFVNVLDFMMVMPLGPDFARALDIPAHHIGLIGGAYTFAAAVSGLALSPFLDRFARKSALLCCLVGLTAATLLGAFVWDTASMLAARVLAGIFGGPAFALAIALVADFVPPERRGSAMGKVSGGFAAASVLGVPFGLELAARISWRAPFVTTALIGLAVLIFALRYLPHHPPLTQKESLRESLRRMKSVLNSRLILASYAFMGAAMMSGFLLIPNISAHLQMNLGYPREHLGVLYFCGGAVSFVGMRLAGRLMDRSSATATALLFTGVLMAAIVTGFIVFPSPVPVLVVFICFMVGMTGRNVCDQALSSKIPRPQDRAAYMALQASVTHLACAVGASLSSHLLAEEAGKLLHVQEIGALAVLVALTVPVLMLYVERSLKGRAAPAMPLPAVEAA